MAEKLAFNSVLDMNVAEMKKYATSVGFKGAHRLRKHVLIFKLAETIYGMSQIELYNAIQEKIAEYDN